MFMSPSPLVISPSIPLYSGISASPSLRRCPPVFLSPPVFGGHFFPLLPQSLTHCSSSSDCSRRGSCCLRLCVSAALSLLFCSTSALFLGISPRVSLLRLLCGAPLLGAPLGLCNWAIARLHTKASEAGEFSVWGFVWGLPPAALLSYLIL